MSVEREKTEPELLHLSRWRRCSSSPPAVLQKSGLAKEGNCHEKFNPQFQIMALTSTHEFLFIIAVLLHGLSFGLMD